MTDRGDFLQLAGKTILLFGVANRKSVAWHIAQVLVEAGARCLYVVQNEATREAVAGCCPARKSSCATWSTRTRSPAA